MTMTKTKIPRSVIITAICALVVLECAAMYNGMNGTMLAVVIAVIAGLAGWAIPSPVIK